MNTGRQKYMTVLTQMEGLSELVPGILSHSVEEIKANILFAKGNIVVGHSKLVPGQMGYLAVRNIRRGELVFSAFGTLIDHQTPQHSIQIGYGLHIDPHTYGGRYVNHHCEGNLIVKWDKRGLHQYLAAEDIKKSDEVSYAYWRTELEWSNLATENDVTCSCHSPRCIGRILSFRQLPQGETEKVFREGGIAWYLYFERQKLVNKSEM